MPTLHFPHLRDGAFDPDTMRILTSAFDDAWQSLQGDGIILGADKNAMRDMLAKAVIHTAQLGERDQRRLRDAALAHLAQSSVKRGSPS